jgi:DNA anti-recombination protein RmuC
MKNIFVILFAVFSLNFLLMPLAQSFASETLKGADKDLDSFKKEMGEKLDRVERELQSLRVKTKTKGNEVQQNVLRDLEKTRNQLRNELDSMEAKSKDNWKDMKKSLSESFEKLHSKLQNALKN